VDEDFCDIIVQKREKYDEKVEIALQMRIRNEKKKYFTSDNKAKKLIESFEEVVGGGRVKKIF
jgi:hypothetical protein